MTIRISRPDLVDALVRALNETECFAARTGAHGLDVFVPWSRTGDPAQAGAEVLFFVKAWGLGHPGFDAQLAG